MGRVGKNNMNANETNERFTKRQISFHILELYKKDGKQNIYNVLGGKTKGQQSPLEFKLKLFFTDRERRLAGGAFNDLKNRGLIAPTYSDLMSPGDWCIITDDGTQALKSNALDDLDDMLLKIGAKEDLIAMRDGAHEAVISQRTDWHRHAATSCSELITKVLHTIAPDDEISKQSWFKPDSTNKNKINRKHRIEYYLRKKKDISKDSIKVIEKASELIDACYKKLQSIKHTDKKEVEGLIKLTEDALLFLLSGN